MLFQAGDDESLAFYQNSSRQAQNVSTQKLSIGGNGWGQIRSNLTLPFCLQQYDSSRGFEWPNNAFLFFPFSLFQWKQYY